jgi:hypothetical protein
VPLLLVFLFADLQKTRGWFQFQTSANTVHGIWRAGTRSTKDISCGFNGFHFPRCVRLPRTTMQKEQKNKLFAMFIFVFSKQHMPARKVFVYFHFSFISRVCFFSSKVPTFGLRSPGPFAGAGADMLKNLSGPADV